MRVIRTTKKQLRNPHQRRMDKAISLFSKGYVIILDKDNYKVWSETEPTYSNGRHLGYLVTLDYDDNEKEDGDNSCSCPDFIYNSMQCKHILAAEMARHELGYPIKHREVKVSHEFYP